MGDKEIIDVLLDALESCYADTTAMRAMIATYRQNFPGIGEWEHDLEDLRTAQTEDVRKLFAGLRAAVGRTEDLDRALKQFLRATARKGPVQ